MGTKEVSTTDETLSFSFKRKNDEAKVDTPSNILEQIHTNTNEVSTTNMDGSDDDITNPFAITCDVIINEETNNELLFTDTGQINLKNNSSNMELDSVHVKSFDDVSFISVLSKPHQCNECDKAFVDINNLEKHRWTHQYRPSKYTREKLKYESYNSNLFTGFLNKPFKCTQCDKAFVDSGNLDKHILTHQYKPPYLSKTKTTPRVETKDNSESKSSLISLPKSNTYKSHVSSPTNKQVYQCDKCSRSFIKLEYLTQHQMTHLGLRPFKCDTCMKTYVNFTCLQKHLQIHEKQKMDTCYETLPRSDYVKMQDVIHSSEKVNQCQKYDSFSIEETMKCSVIPNQVFNSELSQSLGLKDYEHIHSNKNNFKLGKGFKSRSKRKK